MKTFNLYLRKYPYMWKLHAFLRKHPCLYVVILFILMIFAHYNVRTITELIGPRVRDHNISEYISEYLDVRLRLLDNFRTDGHARVPMMITLKNTGNVDILSGTWKLYFNGVHGVGTGDLECGLRIDHVNGLLFTLSPPNRHVKLIPAHSSIECELGHNFPSVSKTDFSPNWYVKDGTSDFKVAIIKSTTSESLKHVGEFDRPNLWKRNPKDTFNPYTPSERYRINNRVKSGSQADPFKVIPTPKLSRIDSSKLLTLDKNWVIQHSGDFKKEATYLSEKLNIVKIGKDEKTKGSKVIHLTKIIESAYEREEYELKIDPGNELINILANDPPGAFYGIQTLLSLFDDDKRLPGAVIRDKPRFPFRGLMVDVARNFRPKHTIMKIIDTLSHYKMNRLHLHLSDDEGWRVEIPEIPELTEVGSKRCHSNQHDICLLPSFGSGPFVSMPGSGFYSVSDYREILQYATDRHVQVIPEIDMPGHAMAAVVSMNYRESIKGKYSQFASYRLTDDTISNAISVQNWVGNSINPCLNTSYMFVEKILDSLIGLHKGIQDLTVIHIGGDEVPSGVWDNSEACSKLSTGSEVSHSDLKKLFMYTIADLAAKRGLNVGAWEDGMYDHGVGPYKRSNMKPSEVFINPWNNIWENGRGGRAYEFADEDYKVILTLATNLYFDHPYEPDPQERGLYWATRYIDEETVFGFLPDDLFANAIRLRNGDPTNKEQICKSKTCPSTVKPQNIIGMQACIWGELIRTDNQFYTMLFPRLLAVAERSWHKASWEDIDDVSSRSEEKLRDFASFVNHLGWKELPRLENAGLSYRLPIPGAILKDGMLHVNSQYPNHRIFCSEKNEPPWYEIVNGKTDLHKSFKSLYIKSVSRVSRRSSRAIKVL